MHVDDLLFLIPLLPLLGFAANGLFGRRMSTPQVGLVALLGPVTAFVLSVLALVQAWRGEGQSFAHETVWTWIATGHLHVDFGLQVDPLTAVMLMNVTGIGSLIHLYSYGYMKDDPGFPRFMAYLNLFLCAMLLLVLGDNLLLLFVGWEGVGLCSYLLIGFWYTNLPYTDAGRKAFIVNRIGDFAFLFGAFTLFSLFGTLSFSGMEHALTALDPSTVLDHGPLAGWTVRQALMLSALALFGGATGKSAQIPLYVWLPDAMAGPTPVSALIHAATMVTAGVYLVGRMDFLYVMLPEVGQVIAVVAACTALLAGLIAVGQYDIKKVLAYSTVSQLGYMFAGMGTTVWTTGLYHVVTHAFFKALLFLGAGAIIHAMHHEQDMRKMGGLYKDLPYVTALFLIGCVSLAGVPYVGAGFFSKDEIIGAVAAQMTHEGGLWGLVFGILVFTAALTAFYTVRMALMTFFWPPADDHRHLHHLHWTMPAVLTVLAGLSLFAGAPVGWFIEEFTHPVWTFGAIGVEEMEGAHVLAMASSLVAVAVGIGAALVLYRKPGNALAAQLEALVAGKFYVDEAYEALVVQPLGALAQGLFRVVDRLMIDNVLVEGPAKAVMLVGGIARQTQNGAVSVATATTLFGAVAVLLWMVTRG